MDSTGPELLAASPRKCHCTVNKFVNLISYNTSMVAPKGVSTVSSLEIIRDSKIDEQKRTDAAAYQANSSKGCKCQQCGEVLCNKDFLELHNLKEDTLVSRWLMGADEDADDEEEADDPMPLKESTTL